MREVELDPLVVGPLEPVQAELATDELFRRRPAVGRAEDDERAVDEEDQPTAGPQQASSLRDPAVWIAPDRGAVLREGKVESGIRKRHLLRARLDERKRDPELRLTPPRGFELRRGDVDADRPRAALREPRREVRRPTAELDHVEAGEISENAELTLGNIPHSPHDLVLPPTFDGLPAAFVVVQAARFATT